MHYQESLEYKVDAIYHNKTREYFNEVLSSYNNGNYRSAIVMLYSVVICDLIYKIQELSDRYSDTIADSILDKIKKEQTDSPTNPKWEATLISEIKAKTNLLEPQDELNIDYLRSNRHLAAHPILDQLDMLLNPNKETVRANMVNMLDGILCKPPLLSKKIITTFLEDLVSINGQLVKDIDFKKYLHSKYFDKINKPTEEKLFRDLWKFAFRLEDPKTNEHREVIYKALMVLFNKERTSFISLIERDKSYYSHINLENDSILNLIIDFWSLTPTIYQSMEQPVKVILANKAERDFNIFSSCVFLSNSIQEHFERILSRLKDAFITPRFSEPARRLLFSISKEQGMVEDFLNLLIEIFKESPSYDDADSNFQDYILPYGDLFSKEQFMLILDSINGNSQLYNRRNARRDNNLLKHLIDKHQFEEEIDFSLYPSFRL